VGAGVSRDTCGRGRPDISSFIVSPPEPLGQHIQLNRCQQTSTSNKLLFHRPRFSFNVLCHVILFVSLFLPFVFIFPIVEPYTKAYMEFIIVLSIQYQD
jgi:hypothetical protein